jgi:hypothetical protein
MTVKDKKVLVTGGTSGIGEASFPLRRHPWGQPGRSGPELLPRPGLAGGAATMSSDPSAASTGESKASQMRSNRYKQQPPRRRPS